MAIKPRYAAACRQTVTLYNAYKEGGAQKYHKTVFTASAFLEHKRVWQEARTGVTASNPALLVIPQGASECQYVEPGAFDALTDKTRAWTLRNGDKALHGIGPDISTAQEWAELIPAKNADVMFVQAAEAKRDLSGVIVHVEGGG